MNDPARLGETGESFHRLIACRACYGSTALGENRLSFSKRFLPILLAKDAVQISVGFRRYGGLHPALLRCSRNLAGSKAAEEIIQFSLPPCSLLSYSTSNISVCSVQGNIHM